MAYQPKSYRKFLVGAVSTAVVASSFAGVAGAAANFTDVNSNYKEAVDFLVSKGISGISTTEFGTYQNIKRVDAAVFVVKALGLDVNAAPASGFTDVPDRAAKEVNALKAAGITSGKSATEFGAQDLITRGELAIWLDKAFDLKGEGDVSAFTDANGIYTDAIKALVANNITKGTSTTTFGTKDPAKRGDFAVFVKKAADTVKEEVGELAVKSVSAINAAQLQVKFNQAIDKESVITEAVVAGGDDTLKAGVLTLNKVSGTGLTPVVNNTSLASLSEDGKTLTITLASGQLHDNTYVAFIPKNVVKVKDGDFMKNDFTSNTIKGEDKVVPTITKTENRNATTTRVYFSEPLASEGSWTFKYSNGDKADTDVTVDNANIKKGYVDLKITGATVETGREITATVIGARDYAGNLVSPNPSTVSFSKGAKDGSKPTIESVKTVGLDKFELVFSEEVRNFAVTDISVANTPLTAADTLEQDKDNNKKYTVTLGSSRTAGLATIAIAQGALTDLSGEEIDAFNRVVDFKVDTTAPKLVKSEIKTDAGFQYLHLTFDESVDLAASANTVSVKEVKDFVTKTANVDFTGLTAVSGTDKKEYRVALASLSFNGAALSNNAVYTVTFDGKVEDVANNALGKAEFTFTRGLDSSSSRPEVVTTFDGDQTVAFPSSVINNGVKIIDNNTLHVQFNRELDGASATNPNNYMVSGAEVDSVSLLTGNTVEIKLKKDTNNLNGSRTVTISNVKSKAGVTMDTFTAYEYLRENVRPTITAVDLASSTTVVVTFSEAMATASLTDKDDFKVYTDGSSTANTISSVSAVNAENKKFTITFNTPVQNINNAIQLEVLDAQNVLDANGNKLVTTGTLNVNK